MNDLLSIKHQHLHVSAVRALPDVLHQLAHCTRTLQTSGGGAQTAKMGLDPLALVASLEEAIKRLGPAHPIGLAAQNLIDRVYAPVRSLVEGPVSTGPTTYIPAGARPEDGVARREPQINPGEI